VLQFSRQRSRFDILVLIESFYLCKKSWQMSTQEIKQLLHESIENIDDGEFLIAVKQIIDRKYTPGTVPNLSEWQLERIESSKEQIKHGKSLSNNQADLLVEKWLNE